MNHHQPLRVIALAACLTAMAAAPALAQQLCVTAARANLRAGPSTDNRITWEVYRNMPLIQIGKDNDWVKVRDVDGDTHWIYGRLVKQGDECVTISADVANIRKGPGTNHDKWFSVEKYTSFRKTGQQGNWVRIEYEGETMWVYHTLVWPQ